jgi:hypothetical protein
MRSTLVSVQLDHECESPSIYQIISLEETRNAAEYDRCNIQTMYFMPQKHSLVHELEIGLMRPVKHMATKVLHRRRL